MDISQEKQMQAQLVASETHYRYLFEQNPAPMLIYRRPDLQLVSVNQAFIRHYGYSREDVLRLRLPDLYPETEQAAIIDLAHSLQGHVNVGEWHHRIKSGEFITIIAHSHDFIYAGQDCRVAVITDITALKQVELALQQRNQELESFNAASVGRELTMIELKKQINDLSKHLGQSPPFDMGFQTSDALNISEGKRVEQNVVVKAQAQAQAQAQVLQEHTMARLAILNQMQDANAARIRAELALAALSDSEAQMRTLISSVPDLIWLKDVDGLYLLCNPAFERFCGVPESDLFGHSDYDLFDAALADRFRANDRRAIESGTTVMNAEWFTFAENGYHGLLQALKTPIIDAKGHVVGVLGIARDITALHQAEEDLRAINASLEARVAERTAELDTLNQSLESFVYSVSHDLKAPLRGVEGYSQLLQEDYDNALDDEGRLFIANIRKGVTRMGALIDDLLAYSRMERRRLDSNQLDLVAMINQLLAEKADDITARGVLISTDLATVWAQGDPSGLSIVMRNLLENALKFSAKATPPCIEITIRQENQDVIVKITDNGIGFDMSYHDRIFEIFQRLQRIEDYPGTGVGLALVKKAMQRMGGKVWAESSPGQGASFYLQLPIARKNEK
jgi:PAS domain S-box-containing protein